MPPARLQDTVIAAHGPQGLADPVDVHRAWDGDIDDGSGPVPGEVGDLLDRAVREDDDLPVDGAEPGDAQGDVLDGARHAGCRSEDGDPDHVAEPVLPLGDDEEPGQ